MKQTAIIITTLALAACTNDDIGQTSSGGGTSGASASASSADGDSSGSSGGTGGSDGADSTGGDMCEDVQVEWECNTLAFVAYFAGNGTFVTGANKNGGPAQGPRPCLAPGDIASGGAHDVAAVLECGGPDGGPPPASACVTECGKLTAADLGYADSITLYPGTPAEETRSASILCLEHGEIPSGDWGGIGSQVQGSCAYGADPAPTATTTPCGSSQCAELEGECSNYTTGHGITTTTSGNTIDADIDYKWVRDLEGNIGLAWCDPGRYTFFDQTFYSLTASSLMYQLGIRTGDTDLQAWEHDPVTRNRVGSVYTIEDLQDGIDAYAALIPAARADTDPVGSSDIHVTVSVKRNGISKTIHVDAEE